MPETSPTTQDEAGVTRTPTGTIVDQSPTSTPATSQPDKLAEALQPSIKDSSTTTTQPSETPKETKLEAPKSLINEKSEEPKGAPEKYEDFKVPEGYVLDEKVGKEAGDLFKELDLNQVGAQKLVDFYIAKTREAQQRPYNTYADMRQQWRDEVNQNPELGGTRLNATRSSIGRLIDAHLGKYAEGFREAMDYTGAGDHPAVVGALVMLSKLLTEGGAVRGNGPVVTSPDGRQVSTGGPIRPSAAQAMYPHLKSNQTG